MSIPMSKPSLLFWLKILCLETGMYIALNLQTFTVYCQSHSLSSLPDQLDRWRQSILAQFCNHVASVLLILRKCIMKSKFILVNVINNNIYESREQISLKIGPLNIVYEDVYLFIWLNNKLNIWLNIMHFKQLCSTYTL